MYCIHVSWNRECGAGEQSRVGRSVAVGYTVDRFRGLVETDRGTAALPRKGHGPHVIPSNVSPPASLGRLEWARFFCFALQIAVVDC
jgi:hypothetical protein